MKVVSRNLWIVLAVVLLIALFAAIQVTAAPAAQSATATPAPTKPAPVVDTAAPTVPWPEGMARLRPRRREGRGVPPLGSG